MMSNDKYKCILFLGHFDFDFNINISDGADSHLVKHKFSNINI